eukprot:TRINITY_DN1014_c1_g1_i1.p1 TRINITY_DN1014_c1_g1~~TRINITY_DN1014_c1_g1_i1.p1  ORF type:complete len:221 (-),score=19.52 TRINITY_DN1014_c1_g1_i1:46-708(-)
MCIRDRQSTGRVVGKRNRTYNMERTSSDVEEGKETAYSSPVSHNKFVFQNDNVISSQSEGLGFRWLDSTQRNLYLAVVCLCVVALVLTLVSIILPPGFSFWWGEIGIVAIICWVVYMICLIAIGGHSIYILTKTGTRLSVALIFAPLSLCCTLLCCLGSASIMTIANECVYREDEIDCLGLPKVSEILVYINFIFGLAAGIVCLVVNIRQEKPKAAIPIN